MSAWATVVGLGNRFRRDDRVGLEVLDRLDRCLPPGVRTLTLEGELITLLDVVAESDLVIVVDALASATLAPGTIHRFDCTDAAVPHTLFGVSTHAFGLADSIELARTLGRIRGRVLVYGIAGGDFRAGESLSAEVAPCVETAARQILDELRLAQRRPAARR